ncbi:BbrUII/HgiDII family restriction enzyme [Rhodococcus sp. no. 34]
MSSPTPKFSMTVDMSVLEALGINLYSNAAAVLSELVANAWDADAGRIEIDWRKTTDKSVVVHDTGCGMTVNDVNNKFLKVGYQKRVSDGAQSPKWGRDFMGRKGIGKLSIFSIANVVEVFSQKGDEKFGLKIDVDDLRHSIASNNPYNPDEIEIPFEFDRPGTTIVLSSLKHSRADITASALRKRIARRFDVLDETPEDEGGFQIHIDGKRVTYADRQELKKLEFIWEFGKETLPTIALPTKINRFVLKDNVVDAAMGWTVNGWIGTAKTPTQLTDDDEAGSLKNIIVLARKRPIQEGIIEKLDFSRIFGNYVTGQIEANFLDLDDKDDIATSDRQRLIEDDPRVQALQKFLRQQFLIASEEWAKARPSKGAVDALAQFPKVKAWVDSRPAWQQEHAKKMIGTIATLALEGKQSEDDRKTLFRSGILAFERLGLRQTVNDLEKLSNVTAEDLLPVLAEQTSYESALYIDILSSRLEAITKFREISDADEKEKVLQQHLFENLWLLDPSWERAASSAVIEQDLRRISPGEYAMDEAGKEIRGRIDIRYATSGGKNVIVELKRYGRSVTVSELVEQGGKYLEALDSVLKTADRASEKTEVIFVLGDHPKVVGYSNLSAKQVIDTQLSIINGRYVLYDNLISNARHQYSEYLEASDKAKALEELLSSL